MRRTHACVAAAVSASFLLSCFVCSIILATAALFAVQIHRGGGGMVKTGRQISNRPGFKPAPPAPQSGTCTLHH